MDLKTAMLLAAVIGGTSSAIVIPLTDSLPSLRNDLKLVLKLESVLTDPLVIIVALVLLQASFLTKIDTTSVIKSVLHMLSTSIVMGFFAGVVWWMIWRKFRSYEFHYMLTLAFLIFMYVITEFLGGNGAIAVFMIGLVLGNIRKVKQMLKLERTLTGLSTELMKFNSYITFFIRALFFSAIGMSIQLSDTAPVIMGIFISAIIFLARYTSVYIFSLVEKMQKKEGMIMSVIAPRGLASAVLAIMISTQFGFPNSDLIVQIVFTVILTTVVISTLGTIYFGRKGKGAKEISSSKVS
jgi:cell volume regulation protein A